MGYKKHEQAKNAIKQANNTFINLSKISIDFAKPYHDTTIERPWSKYSEGSSRNDKYQKSKAELSKEKKKKPTKEQSDAVDDGQLNEFLGIAEKDKTKFWANDVQPINEKVTKDEEEQEDDEMEQNEDDEEEPSRKRVKGETGKHVSDLDFLKSKVVKKLEGDEQDTEMSKEEEEEENDEGRVFVYNLSYSTTEDELSELFKPFGTISEIHLPIDKETKRSKGMAFVLFMIPENANAAIAKINNTIYQGRLIYAIPAKKRQMNSYKEKDSFFSGTSSYKKKLEAQRKAMAQSQHNWNSLFIRSDTVADSISKQIGVSKRDMLLGGDVENAAVRLALGETELIQQTKEELSEHGINLEVLNDKNVPRSKNVIMVKNLPFESNEDQIRKELHELFSSRGGQVSRVVVPESRAVALVEFHEPNDARTAFKACAYRQFHRVPLYLEWAPVGLLKEKKKAEKKDKKEKKTEEPATTEEKPSEEKENKDKKEKKTEEKPEEPAPVRISQIESEVEKESATLFVKNLNFSTKEEGLEELFKKYKPRKTTIARSKKGSKGFGFVEFDNIAEAVKAHNALQGAQLDNHVIVLQYSNIGRDSSSKETKKEAPANKTDYIDDEGRVVSFRKIIVRNVAFEATRQDLYQLFSSYGELKTVRLPRKVNSADQHRGFAFIEFVSPKECHAAYEALKSTHLYGRHLVLEYAADENSVEAKSLENQREKMNEQFQGKEKTNKRKRHERV